MWNRKRIGVLAACLVAVAPLTSISAAEGLDGSKNVVCAVMDVVGCVESGVCLQGKASSFDLPEFVIVDAKEKVVRGTHESGHDAVSAIKNMERNGSHLILQGVENSRGWEIAIDAETGKMSGALAGEAVSFLVFGACTAP
jgi:hypothetical protein